MTMDGHVVGECDEDIFEIVVAYLADGRSQADVAKELLASGVPHALDVVVNAKRVLKERGILV
ncbi:MAG: hypothetical protein Q7R91_00360 [bacterium]|nr:hypothetical protein [bacterium]